MTDHTVETAPAQKEAPIGVGFRLDSPDYAVMMEYASAKKMSMQELLENAVNLMRKADGLEPIKGRPRSKTRRKML